MDSEQLVIELSAAVESSLAESVVRSYVEMQQRFIAGDWGPAELDGGRLCEAVARCFLQLDRGTIAHNELPGAIRSKLLDESQPHALSNKDRHHLCKVIELVYKFRSDRGAVHISPLHTANYQDAILILHAGKWLFAELLRLAWRADRAAVAETIAQLVQLEHSLVHELDGRPLILAANIPAPDEVLLLLFHAPGNRLLRGQLREYAVNQKADTIGAAVRRLIEQRAVRAIGPEEIALTPLGQKRVFEAILPKLTGIGKPGG